MTLKLIASAAARSACGLAVGLLALAGTTQHAQASTIALGFASLPSAQGFTFGGTVQPESSIYSVSGGVLHQDATGTGPLEGADYTMLGVVPNQPFSITFTGRVTQEVVLREGAFGHFGMGFGAEANGWEYFIGIGGGFIDGAVAGGPGLAQTQVLSTAFDTSVFHDYLLNATPGDGGFTLSVDGVQIFTGTGIATSPFSDDLFFGNPTSRAHTVGDITQFVFRSSDGGAAPEPATWAMMLVGFGGLGGQLRRRRRMALFAAI